jgi:hypothetical protein
MTCILKKLAIKIEWQALTITPKINVIVKD